MTRVMMLKALKERVEACTGDLQMPTAVQRGDAEAITRAPEVFIQRLPDSTAAKKIVPYVLLQLASGADRQSEGLRSESTAVVRIICTAYCSDEQEGSVMLLNMMDRIRLSLLQRPVFGDCFELDVSDGLETAIYIDDTAPYYAGEMIGTIQLPPVNREVNYE